MNGKNVTNVGSQRRGMPAITLFNNTQPRRRNKSSDTVYDYVVNSICSRRFLAGDRLVERDLAERLNMSHIPVREALERLAHNDWTEQIPRKGTYVKRFDHKEIEEIYLLRQVIELGIIAKVAENITDEQLAQLQGMVDILEAANEANDAETYRDADFQFHYLVVKFAGSARLEKFYETLMLQIRYCCFVFWRLALEKHLFSLTSLQSSITHRMIYEAISGRDAKWSKQVLEQHLKRSCSVNIATLAWLESQEKSEKTEQLESRGPT